jgi:hypothetical protein
MGRSRGSPTASALRADIPRLLAGAMLCGMLSAQAAFDPSWVFTASGITAYTLQSFSPAAAAWALLGLRTRP